MITFSPSPLFQGGTGPWYTVLQLSLPPPVSTMPPGVSPSGACLRHSSCILPPAAFSMALDITPAVRFRSLEVLLMITSTCQVTHTTVNIILYINIIFRRMNTISNVTATNIRTTLLHSNDLPIHGDWFQTLFVTNRSYIRNGTVQNQSGTVQNQSGTV